MIGEITPLVQAAGRGSWLRAAAAHAFGAAVSAGLLGVILGSVGLFMGLSRVGTWAELLTGTAFLLVAARDAGLAQVALPSLDRQTPRWFRKLFTPVWYSLLWGADLGQGWTTRIQFAGYYGLLLWAILLGNPVASAMVFACYGFGRALPVVAAGAFGSRMRIAVVRNWTVFSQPLLLQANAFALALVGSLLLAALVA